MPIFLTLTFKFSQAVEALGTFDADIVETHQIKMGRSSTINE